MTSSDAPAPIRELAEATNAGDTERFVAAFTDDAYLNDWGREFHGHGGVRDWDSTDNIGKQAQFEIVSVAPGKDPESYVVSMKVTGNGFNGTGAMAITLRDGKIASLGIS
jgi:SnoaL-like protein